MNENETRWIENQKDEMPAQPHSDDSHLQQTNQDVEPSRCAPDGKVVQDALLHTLAITPPRKCP